MDVNDAFIGETFGENWIDGVRGRIFVDDCCDAADVHYL
jgi:hypothetical protein